MSNSVTSTGSSVVSARTSQTKNVASHQILPASQQYNSPIDVMFTMPSFMIDSVEQAVSPALAAQSYQTNFIEAQSGNGSVCELGPRSGKL